MGITCSAVNAAASPFPDLHLATWENTVPFIPPVSGGYVIKVYDGDTITIANRLQIPNSPMYRFSVRLRGINAAEIKPRNGPQFEEAIRARDALAEMVLGKFVLLDNVGTEKYGRVLADVYVMWKTGKVHINLCMLAGGLAVPFMTTTKGKQ